MKNLIAKELLEMPTLYSGYADDLKFETSQIRIWVSRVGVSDGAPCNNLVTVERLVNGKWVSAEQYGDDGYKRRFVDDY